VTFWLRRNTVQSVSTSPSYEASKKLVQKSCTKLETPLIVNLIIWNVNSYCPHIACQPPLLTIPNDSNLLQAQQFFWNLKGRSTNIQYHATLRTHLNQKETWRSKSAKDFPNLKKIPLIPKKRCLNSVEGYLHWNFSINSLWHQPLQQTLLATVNQLPVYYPLEACYDSVMNDPQLSWCWVSLWYPIQKT
jgi:hypothetical protein